MSKLSQKHFTASGSWTAPAGVKQVYILAHGGGAGGSGGTTVVSNRGYPACGTVPVLQLLDVVPNTTYTITIGTGGLGGAPRTTTTQNGGTGGNTTFGALFTFEGAKISNYSGQGIGLSGSKPGWVVPRHGGYNSSTGVEITSGHVNVTSAFGADAGSYNGGWNGSPGYVGSTVGTGGAASAAGTGSNGGAGSGYGYGGGSGGGGAVAGGSGSDGGPGQLWVIWVE